MQTFLYSKTFKAGFIFCVGKAYLHFFVNYYKKFILQRTDIIMSFRLMKRKGRKWWGFTEENTEHTRCCLCDSCVTCCICRYFHRLYFSLCECGVSGVEILGVILWVFCNMIFFIVESSYIWKNLSGGEWWCRWKACSDVFSIFVRKSFFRTSDDVNCVKFVFWIYLLMHPSTTCVSELPQST